MPPLSSSASVASSASASASCRSSSSAGSSSSSREERRQRRRNKRERRRVRINLQCNEQKLIPSWRDMSTPVSSVWYQDHDYDFMNDDNDRILQRMIDGERFRPSDDAVCGRGLENQLPDRNEKRQRHKRNVVKSVLLEQHLLQKRCKDRSKAAFQDQLRFALASAACKATRRARDYAQAMGEQDARIVHDMWRKRAVEASKRKVADEAAAVKRKKNERNKRTKEPVKRDKKGEAAHQAAAVAVKRKKKGVAAQEAADVAVKRNKKGEAAHEAAAAAVKRKKKVVAAQEAAALAVKRNKDPAENKESVEEKDALVLFVEESQKQQDSTAIVVMDPDLDSKPPAIEPSSKEQITSLVEYKAPTTKKVQFSKRISVRKIHHLKDMTNSMKCATWYQSSDLKRMKLDRKVTLQQVLAGARDSDEDDGAAICARGTECLREKELRKTHKKRAWQAVLKAQAIIVEEEDTATIEQQYAKMERIRAAYLVVTKKLAQEAASMGRSDHHACIDACDILGKSKMTKSVVKDDDDATVKSTRSSNSGGMKQKKPFKKIRRYQSDSAALASMAKSVTKKRPPLPSKQ